LQNIIERAVILTTGECLEVPLEELRPPEQDELYKRCQEP